MEGAISLSGELPALPDIPIETDHRAGPGPSAESGAHRRLYGRQRATPVPGVAFIARLGPASSDHSARHNAVTVEATGSGAALVPDAETLIEDLRFVSVDCETTGQNPHHLVEVGAVVFTMAAALPGGDGVHPPPDAFETLVHTADHINPYARRVHGISRAMLHGAPSALPVLRRFLTFARGTVLVEHSADAFDTRLIGRTLGRPLPHPTIDTSRLAKHLFDLRDTIGLERLCLQLGVPHRAPHAALGDAEATAGCLVELIRRGQEQFGWRTLADLLEVGHPPAPRLKTGGRQRGERPGLRPPAAPATGPEPAPTPVAAAPDASAPPSRARRRRRGRRGGRSHPATDVSPASS